MVDKVEMVKKYRRGYTKSVKLNKNKQGLGFI